MSSHATARTVDSGLRPNYRCIGYGMAEDASRDGWSFSSIPSIMHNTGYSRRQVIDLLAEMVEAGVLSRHTPDDLPEDGGIRKAYLDIPGNKRPVIYRLLWVLPEWDPVRGAILAPPSSAETAPLDPSQAVPSPEAVDQGPADASGDVSEPSAATDSDESRVQSSHPSAFPADEARGAVRGAEIAPNGETQSKNSPSLRSGERPEAAAILGAVLSHGEDAVRERMLELGYEESESQPWVFRRSDGKVDVMWEALVEVTGATGKFTKQGRRSFNSALEQLREVAGPAELLRRGARMLAKRKVPAGTKQRPAAWYIATYWHEWGDAADDRFATGDTRREDLRQRLTTITGGRA